MVQLKKLRRSFKSPLTKTSDRGVEKKKRWVLNRYCFSCINFKPESRQTMSNGPLGCCINCKLPISLILSSKGTLSCHDKHAILVVVNNDYRRGKLTFLSPAENVPRTRIVWLVWWLEPYTCSTCVINRNIPREVDKFSEIASICSVSASNMIDTCY